MKSKTIANWLVASLVLAGLNAVILGELEAIYSIAGLGFVVFGIMAIVRLYKYAEQEKLGNL